VAVQRPHAASDETAIRFSLAQGWLDAGAAPQAGGDATGNAQRVPLAKMVP